MPYMSTTGSASRVQNIVLQLLCHLTINKTEPTIHFLIHYFTLLSTFTPTIFNCLYKVGNVIKNHSHLVILFSSLSCQTEHRKVWKPIPPDTKTTASLPLSDAWTDPSYARDEFPIFQCTLLQPLHIFIFTFSVAGTLFYTVYFLFSTICCICVWYDLPERFSLYHRKHDNNNKPIQNVTWNKMCTLYIGKDVSYSWQNAVISSSAKTYQLIQRLNCIHKSSLTL